MMKKTLILLVCVSLAFLTLAGCSLARTDEPAGSGSDHLCGIWVVSDPNLRTEDGFNENDADYIGISDVEKTSVFTRGNMVLVRSGEEMDDDSASNFSVTGALYLDSAGDSSEYMYSVYERPDGTHYTGICFSNEWHPDFRTPTLMSTEVTETVSFEGSETLSSGTEFILSLEMRDVCTGASIIEMDKDNLVLKTTVLDLNHPAAAGDYEYEIEAMPETAMIIVEETSASGEVTDDETVVSPKIYRTIYSRSDESGELPLTHIIGVQGDGEVLVPYRLHIIFG